MVMRWLAMLVLLAACSSSDVKRTTDVFVTIEAMDTARAATSVRVQVERVVVELPVEGWPLELVVLPRAGNIDRPFGT